jgi:uncharacterized membrane protein YphA (DoxX/SURF4 family)
MRWMFGFGSPMTMAVVRILFGALIFTNYCFILPFFEDWFTEKGFVPVRFISPNLGEAVRFNPLYGNTDPTAAMVIYGLTLVAALCTALGLFTRLSTVVLLLGITALHHRTSDILHSGDTMMRVFALYLALAPCGLTLSLDRWMQVKSGKAKPVPDVSLWPQRLMEIQVAIVYFTTVWHKWQGTAWRDGTATWFTAQLKEFDRFPVPAFMESRPMVAMTTWGTLIVEIALATLVFWRPARNWVILAGVLLHLGIEYQMNIPLFAFIMIASYASFIEGEEWPGIFEKARGWWRGLRRRKATQHA